MTLLKFAAAIVAAGSSLGAVQATTSPSAPGGHYEWRNLAQPGPRAPVVALRRIWVSAAGPSASCDCARMKAPGGPQAG
jgi:hypothetical protein